MVVRQHVALFQIALLVLSSFWFSVAFAPAVAAQQQVCCSETVEGEFCQYTAASNCKPGSLQSPTVCEQTSFCKLGCGFDAVGGKCFTSTPRFSCEQQEGCEWNSNPFCDIAQCQLGCCVLSNECSFTTQLECKRLTSQFPSVNMSFDEGIGTEVACINQCRSFERGACVFPDGSCTLTTRDGCPMRGDETIVNGTGAKAGFHSKLLCSHPSLGTECARQQYTGCLPDREEVYWFDSCGNAENIYGSDKDTSYNNGVLLSKEESCNPDSNNLNNADCGNCNYLGGTLCMKVERGKKPTFGDYACEDINCGVDSITQEKTAPASGSAKKVGGSCGS